MQFDRWISSQPIGDEAKELLEEAITCFKASAFRASLLLSYLGFQTVLKDRMLASQPPNGYSDRQWRAITNNLLDDDKWDFQVYESTQARLPRSVFQINEDLRNQVTYWKNRRNDCAHSKKNEVSFAHVEAFWQFIRSNLAKFVVRGSVEGLLEELRIHFDRSQTPAGASHDAIIARIHDAIEPNEVSPFLEGVLQLFDKRGDHEFDTYSPEELDLFFAVLQLDSQHMQDGTRQFLLRNERLLLEVLRSHPPAIHHFAGEQRFIRNLWYDQLFTQLGENHFPLYVTILRNDLVPEDQIAEAHSRVIRRIRGANPTAEEFKALTDYGFLDAFKIQAFDENRISIFNWANSNSTLIITVLRDLDLDEQVVASLGATFSVENHPWELRHDLNAHLRLDEEFRTELREAFQQFNVRLPRHLESLVEEPAEADGG